MQRMKKAVAIALMCVPGLLIAGCTNAIVGTATAAGPSEAAVHAAVEKILTDNGLPADQAASVADCMAPLLMEQLSTAGLTSLIEDGEDAIGTDDDEATVNAIAQECAAEAGLGD